jgi:hypothetical protein
MSGYRVEAMSGFEEKEGERIKFCIACNEKLPCKCIWAAIRQLQADVEGLRDRTFTLDRMETLEKRMNVLLLKTQGIESCMEKWADEHEMPDSIPHTCPVCNGYGSPKINENTHEAPKEYYLQNSPCHPCSGKGVIWGYSFKIVSTD